MAVDARPLLRFERTYADALAELVVPWQAAPSPAPRLLVINEPLAADLGADPGALRTPEGLALLTGAAATDAVAQGYAGHQFGNWVPRLGDGRALLLGEVVDAHGARRDLHLKGSGRTPFARGGDGKAAIGPMLREHVVSEAMHALGIPTTRSLAVVATGEAVMRETPLPGAILARVGASHLRVGTFQYAASGGGPEVVRRLADYAIARHYPGAGSALELFEAVVEAQASLVARWMHVGFVHGVMNTDNVTISGETIDYGPCAFLDVFDPAAVFSSIDHGARYAFGNQPNVAQWNLARFAETLLPLIDEGTEAAIAAVTGVLTTFPERFDAHWRRGMRAKLGVPEDGEDVIEDLLALLRENAVDWTSFFRSLAEDRSSARAHFLDTAGFDAWHERWTALGPDVEAMNRVNPVYIPRNHLVEEALTAATAGDLGPVERLLDVLAAPFDERPGLEPYAAPAPESFGRYRTFCGT